LSKETYEKILFKKALIYARDFSEKKVVKGSSAHRQMLIKAQFGYMIIEERLYIKK
jgi:hypothetical protein